MSGSILCPQGSAFDALLVRARGDGRHPHIDLSCPLLIVYTSGTTGRPKGAVLRQEALLWNAVMSQHMHGLTSDDHVLTVLPFFHVGGLNIQTTPALHFGATVTILSRFTPEAAFAVIRQHRPTLTVLPLMAASVVSGVKRERMVTVAPCCSAGVVWILRPPTWKNGSTVST